ncbi:MAG: PHP domain-containing protein [Lachnospiraceae bacterium]
MKDYDFFPGEGKFYKANLHCHTVISDGKLTKEQIKEEYQKRGYSIVAFTDHRTYGYHPELTDENFIALAGIEVDVSENPEKCGGWPHAKCYHLNFYDEHPEEGKEFPLPTYVYEDMAGQNAYIKERTEAGFLCCYNHPYWSLQNYDDYKDFEGLWAMEIYNHGCEHDGLYGFNPQSYDEMLRSGQKLFTVATDDNHNIFPVTDSMCDSFGGFIQIKASELTYEAVIKAMKEGNFYFSHGSRDPRGED